MVKKKYIDAVMDWLLCGGFVFGVLQIPVLFISVGDAIPVPHPGDRDYEMVQRILWIDVQNQRHVQGPQIAVALVLFIIGVIYHRKQIFNWFK